ncbi:MAG: DUF2188 domain-containing protein [Bacilli bacterium]|jgi:hypothetical protein|nr:DUF2188 domain-containing protein [Bacilli bacterium]MDY0399955.1 DUF2188 domain-containing protein [Bacilli bacterium]
MGEVDKRAYHITFRREDSKWQVKLAGSDKPIKIFPTKEECYAYTLALVENTERNIYVHKKNGQLQKLSNV